MTHFTGHSGLA